MKKTSFSEIALYVFYDFDSQLSKIKTQLVGGTFGRLILKEKTYLYLLARAGKADMIPDAPKILGTRFFSFKINLPNVPHDH